MCSGTCFHQQLSAASTSTGHHLGIFAAPLTHVQVHASTSNQQLPALAIHDCSMSADVNPKSTTLTSTSRPQGTVSACLMQCTLSVASQCSVIISPQKTSPVTKEAGGKHSSLVAFEGYTPLLEDGMLLCQLVLTFESQWSLWEKVKCNRITCSQVHIFTSIE